MDVLEPVAELETVLELAVVEVCANAAPNKAVVASTVATLKTIVNNIVDVSRERLNWREGKKVSHLRRRLTITKVRANNACNLAARNLACESEHGCWKGSATLHCALHSTVGKRGLSVFRLRSSNSIPVSSITKNWAGGDRGWGP